MTYQIPTYIDDDQFVRDNIARAVERLHAGDADGCAFYLSGALMPGLGLDGPTIEISVAIRVQPGDTFEAVTGYGLDAECAMWGKGSIPGGAVHSAVRTLIEELAGEIENGDVHECIVYRNPVMRTRTDGSGDDEVFAWTDRGRLSVTYVSGPDGGVTWTESPIVWDGVAVTP